MWRGERALSEGTLFHKWSRLLKPTLFYVFRDLNGFFSGAAANPMLDGHQPEEFPFFSHSCGQCRLSLRLITPFRRWLLPLITQWYYFSVVLFFCSGSSRARLDARWKIVANQHFSWILAEFGERWVWPFLVLPEKMCQEKGADDSLRRELEIAGISPILVCCSIVFIRLPPIKPISWWNNWKLSLSPNFQADFLTIRLETKSCRISCRKLTVKYDRT